MPRNTKSKLPGIRVPGAGKGRPSIYTDEIAEEICARIASGRALHHVCMDEDMPSEYAVKVWRRTKPEFREMILIAREDCADTLIGQMIDIAHRVQEPDGIDPARAAVAANTLDKAIGRMTPRSSPGGQGGAFDFLDAPAEIRLIAVPVPVRDDDDDDVLMIEH